MEGTFKPARSGCAETLIAAESRHIGTNRFLDECIGDFASTELTVDYFRIADTPQAIRFAEP
jgi:hypothetical protein